MKIFLTSFFWVISTFILLIIGVILVGNFRDNLTSKTQKIVFSKSYTNYQNFAALPKTFEGYLSVQAKTGDARPLILKNFLKNSDLEPYYGLLVRLADDNQIEFNIAPAIAMCESNLGKNIPSGSYNPWGYGIPTGAKSGTYFDNWEHSIRREIELLRQLKNKIGLVEMHTFESLTKLGAVYAPPSVEKNHSWARCVSQFMEQMQ